MQVYLQVKSVHDARVAHDEVKLGLAGVHDVKAPNHNVAVEDLHGIESLARGVDPEQDDPIVAAAAISLI